LSSPAVRDMLPWVMFSLVNSAALLPRTSPLCAVATIPTTKRSISIVSQPFRENNIFVPALLHKSTYLSAQIAGVEIGGAGMQLLICDANGQNSAGVPSGKGLRPRAVVSGTLFVEPRLRRQGIAQRLLRELEGRARWWGATEVLLPVDANNQPALRLYAKCGYVRTPDTRDRKAAGELCMRRHLYSPTQHSLLSVLPQHTVVDM